MRQRKIIDILFIAFGILGGIVFILDMVRSYYALALSVLVIFLGITDFGRRCPLVLSLRYLFIRLRSKEHPPNV